MASFIEQLKHNGVVGAGGAGFPAARKFDASAEVLIANAAECEPLFAKDMAVLAQKADSA